MEAANKGNSDKKAWKVPPGYESAIAKARKAAKAAEAASKGGKMRPIGSTVMPEKAVPSAPAG